VTWWDEIVRKPVAESEVRLWDVLDERINYLDCVPRKSGTAECMEVREMRAGVHFVLRDTEQATFMRLAPEEYKIWESIDGTRRVRDIIQIYLSRSGWFSFERASRFLAELERNGFLQDAHHDVYGELASKHEQNRLGPVIAALRSLADRSACSVPRLDTFARFLVESSARVVWVRWVLLLLAGLAAGSGGWAFVLAVQQREFSPFRIGGSYGLGLIVLLASYIVAVNLAQLTRGISAKTLGFGIERSRLRFGWRGPAIVLDGADLPIATLRERTLMEFLSVYVQLVLGGAAGTLAYFAAPGSNLAEFGFVAGCAAYIAVFLDIMPFAPSAGYGLFDEWAAVPALRSRAALYAVRDLVPRVLGKRPVGRTDRMMILFCGWCVLWLAAAARVCVSVLRDEAPVLLAQLAAERTLASIAALIILGLLALVTALYSLGVTGFIIIGLSRYLIREGLLRWLSAYAAISAVAWVAVALALLLSMGEGSSWQAAAAGGGSAALATLASVRLVRWRADPRPARYHYVAWTMGMLAVVLLVVAGLNILGTDILSAGAVRLADAMVMAMFVLLVIGEAAFLRDVGRGLGGFRLVVVGVVVAVTVALFVRSGPAYMVVGLLAALPACMVVASFGSVTFPAWLLAWSSVLVFTSGQAALWRPGTLTPFPVLMLTAGLAASWLDVQWAALRRIAHARATALIGLTETSATTSAERAVDGLLAWFAQFCGMPFAAAARRRAMACARTDHAARLYDAAQSVARHAGAKFALAALGRVMASLPWDDRDELDGVLARGPDWLAAARLPTGVSRETRIALLKGVPPLAPLADSTMEQLADLAHLRRFFPGETIYRRGDSARAMYVVVTGSVDLLVEKSDGHRHVVARFVHGDHFGDVSMLLEDEYGSSAKALSTAVCIEIDAATLAACVEEEKGIELLYHEQTDLVERCREMALFSDFTPAMLRHFLSKCRHIERTVGALVIESGQMSEKFHVILSGRCQRSGPSGPRLLAGDCFGQESLLVEEPMPAIAAIENTELLVMSGTDFRSIIGVADAAYQDFAERLRRRMRTI